MDRYTELKLELRSLREQTRSDFNWTVQALTNVRDRLQILAQTSEQIYDKMYEMVEEVRGEMATKLDLLAIQARLEAIEKRLPAA